MERIFGRPIVTQEQMRTRIRELAGKLRPTMRGKELSVGVLKGASCVLCRLATSHPLPMRVEFIVVTSYG